MFSLPCLLRAFPPTPHTQCFISFPFCLFLYSFPLFFLFSLQGTLLLQRRGNVVSWQRVGKWSVGITGTKNSPPSVYYQLLLLFSLLFFFCKSDGAAGDLCVAVSEFDSQIQELFGHQDSDLPCCSRCFWALWSPHLTEYTEVLLQTSVTFCSYNFQALHYPQLSSFSLNWGLH